MPPIGRAHSFALLIMRLLPFTGPFRTPSRPRSWGAVALAALVIGCSSPSGGPGGGPDTAPVPRNITPARSDPPMTGGAGGISPAEQARLDGGQPPYTAADVLFMQGMIGHHAQAVTMARWAPTHDASDLLQRLAERIAVSQVDEITFMKQWLADRGQSVPDANATGEDTSGGHGMHGMHGVMPANRAATGTATDSMTDPTTDSMTDVMPGMMPGMLTSTELAQLDAARGVAFDRLFLTYMIKHHEGALSMVRTLLGSTGAAQDDDVYKFVADVNVDQETEIAFMSQMLNALPPAPSF